MARLRIPRRGRGRVILDAAHALILVEYRRRLHADNPVALADVDKHEAAVVEPLTAEEERWVRDAIDPRAPHEPGGLSEMIQRHFGPIPPPAPAPTPLRLLPPRSERP